MRYRKLHSFASLIKIASAGLVVCAVCSATFCQDAPTAKPSRATPLMGLMGRFTAADVPALGPAETEVAPLESELHIPPDLPGKGMAQHAMLYLGEGYNKLFLVNKGKIIWTYSTGPDWEYDDACMLSNGNILFTRMQYIAEVTPQKKVVWRYDAPPGTEIHTCQPIGLGKVMFVLNGLPPKLMAVNIKTKAVEVEHESPAPSLTDQVTGSSVGRATLRRGPTWFLCWRWARLSNMTRTLRRYGSTTSRALGPPFASGTGTR